MAATVWEVVAARVKHVDGAAGATCLVLEEAGRVLQSSLAQGYSVLQTIPGQRLHAVMEHG